MRNFKEKNQILIPFFQTLLLLFLISGCTRPENEVSKFSFSLPAKTVSKSNSKSASAMTAAELNYVALNVTGPSMNQMFCSWDLEDNRMNGPCRFTENNVFVEIPSGNTRLIQVIAVYRDDASNSMVFKYGDAQSDLSPGDIQVPISLSDVGGSQVGGDIQGRFFQDATSGPSGLMKVYMKPNAARPAMVIQETEMYSGWFRAFSLETAELDYVINGTSLFGGPVNKAKLSALATASGGAMKVDPATAGVEYEVFGFFGNSLGTTGKTANLSSCGSGHYTTCYSRDLGFIGPFKSSGSGYLTITAGSPNKVSWQFLPGIDSSVIDGVTVLSTSTDLTEDQLEKIVMSRGFNCEAYRFTPGVQVLGNVDIGSANQEVATPSLHSPDPKKPLAVCPRKGVSLFTAAIVSPELDDDGGCSTCKYLRFELSSPAMSSGGDKYAVPKSGCVPVSVKIYQGMGTPATAAAATTIIWNAPDWAEIHQNSACNDGPFSNPAITFGAGDQQNGETFHLKITGAAATDKIFSLGTYTGESPQITFSPQYNKVDIVQPLLKVDGPSEMVQNLCYEMSVGSFMDGYLFNPSSAVSVTITGSSSNLVFYPTLYDCQQNNSPSTGSYAGYSILSPNPGLPIGVKNVGVAPESVSVSATGYTSGTRAFSAGSGIQQVTKFKFQVEGTLSLGKCSRVDVIALNQAGFEIPIPNDVTSMKVQLGTSPTNKGEFYTDMSCFSAMPSNPAPEIQISSGSSRATFYFKPTVPEASLELTASTGSGLVQVGGSTVNIPVPGSGYYTYFTPPQLPESIIGSHNFADLNRSFTVQSNIAGIKCYKYMTSPNWADDGTCNGQFNLSTKVFTWSAAEAALDLQSSENYYFGTSTLFWNSGGAKFTPSAYYKSQIDVPNGSSNVPVIGVLNCDVVLTQNGSLSFDDIQAAVDNGSYLVICLKPGTGSAFAPGVSDRIVLPPHKSLIGYLNPSTMAHELTLSGSDSNPVIEVSATSASVTARVANFNIQTIASAAPAAGLMATASSDQTAELHSINNHYQLNSGAGPTVGIGTFGSLILSVRDSFTVSTVGAGAIYGVKVENNNAPASELILPSFNLNSTASSISIAVKVVTGSVKNAQVRILGGSFFGAGAGIIAYNTYSSQVAKAECYDCKFNMSANPYTGSYVGATGVVPVLAQYQYGQLEIFNSTVINAEDSPILSYLGTNTTSFTLTKVFDSIFNQMANAPAIKIHGSSTSPSMQLRDNHFVAFSGTPYLIAGVVSSENVYVAVDGYPSGYGNNVFCGMDASNKWIASLVEDTVEPTGNSLNIPGSILSSTTTIGSIQICNGTH